jgi:hypothetical protein
VVLQPEGDFWLAGRREFRREEEEEEEEEEIPD